MMNNKGTGGEFGVSREMTQYENIKAFSQNITERKQAMMASGMTETRAQAELEALLFEKQVTPDVREARGLVRGFGRMGAELGGFKTYERVAAETPADLEAQRNTRSRRRGGKTGSTQPRRSRKRN